MLRIMLSVLLVFLVRGTFKLLLLLLLLPYSSECWDGLLWLRCSRVCFGSLAAVTCPPLCPGAGWSDPDTSPKTNVTTCVPPPTVVFLTFFWGAGGVCEALQLCTACSSLLFRSATREGCSSWCVGGSPAWRRCCIRAEMFDTFQFP